MSSTISAVERQTAVVTGANTGIGRATATALAARGFRVLATGRRAADIERVAGTLRAETGNPHVEPLVLDLGDFESIHTCAETVLVRCATLDVLINNAGIAPRRGQRTASGFEQAFGVNHVGHFLLTSLLVTRLRQSAPSRIITLSSHAHYGVRGFDWTALRQPTRSRLGYPEYAASKLANVLFSAELARRLAGTGVTTYAVHPGIVASEIWRNVPWPIRTVMTWPMTSPERGARVSVHCATAPAAGSETGLYYDRRGPKTPSRAAQDAVLGRELWERTEDWIRR